MTDLQELIALGPVEPKVPIPSAVLAPPTRRRRDSEPRPAGAIFSDAEMSQLRALGFDVDQLGI
jgi:hypothetical protein